MSGTAPAHLQGLKEAKLKKTDKPVEKVVLPSAADIAAEKKSGATK
ncbi:hypothetical protein MP638_001327 [Amoeboaphelidium occidentale]|nr:hypothetical protein MP638_001327 [Amoeboaphelidium occidentale]